MEQQTKFPIPPYFLFLDTLGAALIGLGLARYFGQVDIIPPVMRFENYGVYFIGFGIALMLPALLHVITRAKSRRENTPPP